MNDPTLDKFGEILMKQVRDKTISDWERIIGGEMKGISAERIREQMSSFNSEQKDLILRLIPQIVDTTLHHLLFTAEQERGFRLTMRGENGIDMNLQELSDGLAGEPHGDRGWIARFSTKSK